MLALGPAFSMAMAVVFVLVLAGIITWLVELYVLVPFDLKYLPLITTNCAVLGVGPINIQHDYNFFQMLISSFAYPVGFGLALVLFAGVRERILLARTPKPFQNTAIGLVTAGMLSLTFFAFKGWV
jgi:Na+-translocating ferredoxin:NAD+ oxidoreductase subunit A